MPPILKKNVDKIVDRTETGNLSSYKRVGRFKFQKKTELVKPKQAPSKLEFKDGSFSPNKNNINEILEADERSEQTNSLGENTIRSLQAHHLVESKEVLLEKPTPSPSN